MPMPMQFLPFDGMQRWRVVSRRKRILCRGSQTMADGKQCRQCGRRLRPLRSGVFPNHVEQQA